jgi:hypothetical protein
MRLRVAQFVRIGGLMAATQLYVGASTVFGTIVQVSPRLYNPEATVQARDGSTRTYQLPFLIAHGVTLAPPTKC